MRAAWTTATACTAPPMTADVTSVQPTPEGECRSPASEAALPAITASRGDITQRAYGWIAAAAPIFKLAGVAETEMTEIATEIETEMQAGIETEMIETGTETAAETATTA